MLSCATWARRPNGRERRATRSSYRRAPDRAGSWHPPNEGPALVLPNAERKRERPAKLALEVDQQPLPSAGRITSRRAKVRDFGAVNGNGDAGRIFTEAVEYLDLPLMQVAVPAKRTAEKFGVVVGKLRRVHGAPPSSGKMSSTRSSATSGAALLRGCSGYFQGPAALRRGFAARGFGLAEATCSTMTDIPCFSVPSRPVQLLSFARPLMAIASPFTNSRSRSAYSLKAIAETMIASSPLVRMATVANGPFVPWRA